ncbi:MAG TPA: response regulator, partial [Rhodobiaceae bacterium]|nr:response regulator [Rhodobiaceae bacterium]
EDSRYACEAMRLLCLRSGARIRRADCIRSARRHLQVYRPSVVVVDLGLPDGNGADLIAELAAAETEKSAVLATSGDDSLEAEAMAAGAQGFLSKPITSLAAFQQMVLAALPA